MKSHTFVALVLRRDVARAVVAPPRGPRYRSLVFSDRASIHVQAGKGGDGGLSFRREKFVPKGGPDGGDGGDGGDVVLLADPSLRDLSALQRRRRIKATRGENGRGARKHGANGESVELHVPVGTQVFADDGGLIADLAHPGARVVLARGGNGGAATRASSPRHGRCRGSPRWGRRAKRSMSSFI